jgi:hypothetical protein
MILKKALKKMFLNIFCTPQSFAKQLSLKKTCQIRLVC